MWCCRRLFVYWLWLKNESWRKSSKSPSSQFISLITRFFDFNLIKKAGICVLDGVQRMKTGSTQAQYVAKVQRFIKILHPWSYHAHKDFWTFILVVANSSISPRLKNSTVIQQLVQLPSHSLIGLFHKARSRKAAFTTALLGTIISTEKW